MLAAVLSLVLSQAFVNLTRGSSDPIDSLEISLHGHAQGDPLGEVFPEHDVADHVH